MNPIIHILSIVGIIGSLLMIFGDISSKSKVSNIEEKSLNVSILLLIVSIIIFVVTKQ